MIVFIQHILYSGTSKWALCVPHRDCVVIKIIPTLQMRKPSLRSCSEHIVMDHTVHKTLLSCEEFILCSLGLGLQSTLGQREEHVTQT